MSRSRDTYEHSGAFVLRSPLLPFGTLDDLAAAPDLATLAERLRALLADPVVREAIFLASPTLDERIDRWLAGEDPDDAEVVRPVLSYVTRMAGRPTPFGLFAGCAVGEIGGETSLTIAPPGSATRHTRLDFGFLAKVVATLGADPKVQPFLTLVPNSSLYRAGGRLRMAEARVEDRGVRYHRVTFEEDEALAETLERARGGARLGDLAAALVDGDITLEEAEEYVGEMVSAQLLVSELGPVVTGPEPVPGMVAALSRHEETAPFATALDEADRVLAALDEAGVGNDRAAYRDLADSLRTIDPDLRIERLFQVDLGRPGDGLVLGDEVLEEIHRAIDLLYKITQKGQNEELTRFRDAFSERYELREVPLAEALDEEIGIGYGPKPALAAEGAPLLNGLVALPRGGAGGAAFTAFDGRLLRILTDAAASGQTSYELTSDDLDGLAGEDAPPLPDALSATVTLASTEDGLRVLVEGVTGPSGARVLGRFCHLDPGIEALVRRHVEAEEGVRPDVTFAEVVHLPEGRIGNILARPVLREHEIPFLAVSGIGEEGRLPIGDLLVSVVGDRIVLRSKKLDREVVPRITNAHNHHTGALAVYRLLGALQYQGVAGSIGWSWGSMQNAPFLPRVTHRRLVLSLAQWNIGYDELAGVRKAKTPEQRYDAVQALREARRLPRRVVVSVGDNDLPVDLDGIGGCELLTHEGRRGGLKLVELYPDPAELPVTSPEGSYAHQIVVPLVKKQPAPAAFTRPRREEEGVEAVFPPGSEWLTAKVYTGRATGDAVLREAVTPLVGGVLRDGLADGWFFIRYADPEDHLRLRFHGEPRTIAGEVLPRLTEALRPLLDDGRVWRVQLDTYRREVGRYGGPEGILRAEQVFRADSEAVLGILAAAEGDEGLGVRWRMAVCGADRLLADGGLDVPARRQAVRRWRDGLIAEHGGTGDNAKKHSGTLFRTEREGLASLLDGTPTDARTAAGLAALARRSEVAGPLLAGTPEDVLGSHCHMHVNRLLRAAQRTQELVVYDLLDRLYAARMGRAKASG